MNTENILRRFSRPLVLSIFLAIAIALTAQGVYAYYMEIDVTISPSSVFVGSQTDVLIYVHDGDHTDWQFGGAPVTLTITPPTGDNQTVNLVANQSGWATLKYNATKVGNYTFIAMSNYNYTKAFGMNVGVQHAISWPRTLTSKIMFIPGIHVSIVPVTGTPTPMPTPAPGATNPPSTTDTVAPVTTLDFTGTTKGNGTYAPDVVCTLTATDNAGGSGVSIIQYSFDGSEWYTYQQPFSIVTPGMITVYYRSADKAGNVEVANVKAIPIVESAQAPSASPSSVPSASPAASASPGLSVEIAALGLIVTAVVLISRRKGKK